MHDRLFSLLRLLDIAPVHIQGVSGGDINDSYRIEVENGSDLFVKINFPDQPTGILTGEHAGLEMMKSAGVTNLPADVRIVVQQSDAALVMPFYSVVSAVNADTWATFFKNLGHMHQITNEYFGGQDNFIGTLAQHNTPRNNWVPFFRDHRLQPQFSQARDAGFLDRSDVVKFDQLQLKLSDLIPIERPALVHGDLWNGNILPTDSDGILLIDPCPYYGHREMDFAMMALFSGIPVDQYLHVYEEIYPLKVGLFDRIEIYQLYYLLAHLNMFGTAYLPGVRRIIRKFS